MGEHRTATALFTASYAVKTLSLYLIAPAVGRYLNAEEAGRFFLYLTVINLGGLASGLGLPTYLQRRAANGAPRLWFTSAARVVPPTAVLVYVAFAVWSRQGSVLLLACIGARGAAQFAEAKLLAGGQTLRAAMSALGQGLGLCIGAMALHALPSLAVPLLAILLGDVLAVALSAAPRARSVLTAQMSRIDYRSALSYSIPLLAASLLNFGLNAIDRFVITGYLGIEQLVDYSLMYTVAFSGHRLVGSTANVRLTARFLRDESSSSDAEVRSQAAFAVMLTALAVVLAITLGPAALKIAVGREIVAGRLSYALVGAGAVMLSAYSFDTMLVKRSADTSRLVGYLGVAVAANVAANMLLLPLLGVQGAAAATFVSYGILYAVMSSGRQGRLVPVKSVIGWVLLVLAVGAAGETIGERPE